MMMEKISIGEYNLLEDASKYIAKIHNRIKHSYPGDTLVLKNLYIALRYITEAKEITYPRVTSHNTAVSGVLKDKDKNLIDNYHYQLIEMLEIELPENIVVKQAMYMIKNIIIAIETLEKTLAQFIYHSNNLNELYLEALNLAKIKLKESRFLMEYKLELMFPDLIDKKRH
jgi:peptide subunit release factor RF-3